MDAVSGLWLEAVLIGVLIVVNGFFAGAEIALVSARRSRIQQLADGGDIRARRVARLQEDPDRFLAQLKKVVNDPAIDVVFNGWPPTFTGKPRNGGTSRIDSEAFKVVEAAVTRHYQTTTLPTMSTGASDMAFLREKGMQCYGIGPATDIEDGPKGFGAHSDQERSLEEEL